MTREVRAEGKVLIVGGGIANFTNVASTFKGIVRALTEYHHLIAEHQIRVYVRRGGPNYQEGLRMMSDLGHSLRVPIHVYGPETHMTAIVAMALGQMEAPDVALESSYTEKLFQGRSDSPSSSADDTNAGVPACSGEETSEAQVAAAAAAAAAAEVSSGPEPLFSSSTTSIVFGMQPRAVQGMFDFDTACGRATPSVAAMVYPFGGNHSQRFYWGRKEVMVPVYTTVAEAVERHQHVTVLVNFASLRSAPGVVNSALALGVFRAIAVIAEGIPERDTRRLNKAARDKGVVIIGPATVGGLKVREGFFLFVCF